MRRNGQTLRLAQAFAQPSCSTAACQSHTVSLLSTKTGEISTFQRPVSSLLRLKAISIVGRDVACGDGRRLCFLFLDLYLFPRYGVAPGHAHKVCPPSPNVLNAPNVYYRPVCKSRPLSPVRTSSTDRISPGPRPRHRSRNSSTPARRTRRFSCTRRLLL